MDGLLVQKIWSTGSRLSGKQVKCKSINYYAVLYGHHIFFMDRTLYFSCKRERDEQERKRLETRYGNLETKKRNSHWFAATTGGMTQQQKKKNWQFINQSTPQLTPTSSNLALITPSPSTLINTRFLIDLNQVSRVQPVTQPGQSDLFELHFKNGQVLFYQAPNTQIMLEWVALIQHQLKIDPIQLRGLFNGFNLHQSRPEHVKDILVNIYIYK